MSFGDRIDASALTVLLDVRHPLAYLALAPAAAFGAERGIAVNWLPFTVQPLRAPSEPGPADDRSTRHKRNRAQMIAREIETYAAAQGLTVREYYRDGDARAVELGWLWMRAHHPAGLLPFLTEAFRAYWAVELDPSDLAATTRLVDREGADGATFEAWAAGEGPEIARGLHDALVSRGIGGVPGYLVEGEFFQGRQHLAMIGWILDGRQGPGPI